MVQFFDLEYAVSFFILAGKLKDAVSVCMKQLSDPQLAIVICRIYEGENGPVLTELLRDQLIPAAIFRQDRWLLCTILTMSKQRDKAFFSVTVKISNLRSLLVHLQSRMCQKVVIH
jgi:RAVE protein 1 C terminal